MAASLGVTFPNSAWPRILGAGYVATAEVSAILNAHVDDVWDMLGDFGTMPNHLARVVSCQLEDDATARGPVGAVRAVELKDGGLIRERLLGHDEVHRRVTYAIEGSSRYPVRSYRAMVQAWPITSSDQTFV